MTFPLVYQILIFCAERDIELGMEWHPRTVAAQVEADAWSKALDNSQWALNEEVYDQVLARQTLGGRLPTIDCFADSYTIKVVGAFYSRHWCPGTRGVDAFGQDWQ